MGKQAKQSRLAKNEALAKARSLRVSPRKLNLVAQLIRGMSAKEALAQLKFNRKAIAKDVLKVVESAIANAENNQNLDVDRLYVKEATVGKSIVMKRFHTRARGRAAGIKKPFSNITVVVAERQDEEKA
ncbi:MAG: 50S ribosomal protein L22 [Proteobacteria bacterium]|nr:50S ribosomal protein L22 [Pseudomonadota bacterium]